MEDTELFGVVVPKGFKTDGSSVPNFWLFRAFMSPYTESLFAGIVHDYQLTIDGHDPAKRKQVDLNFLNNLKASGVGNTQSWVAYYLVRFWSMISMFKNK